ncbi:MAG TPA: RidA family protein [Jiangellaceae bacterium]
MTIERINPEGLYRSPVFSQATIAPAGRTLYIGGQNGIDAGGNLAQGITAQTRQVFENIDTILAAVGATPAEVAKLTIALADTVDPAEGFQAVPAEWATVQTAITVLLVSRLGMGPDTLVEVDAVVALPD